MRLGSRQAAARVTDAAGLARLALFLRSRGALRTRHVTVLTYHRLVQPGPVPPHGDHRPHVTVDLFDRHVAILKSFFSLIDARTLDDHLRGGAPLPRNPAMITFDDGYLDNHDLALPILLRHGVRATFFVSTRYVTERRRFWWDRLEHAIYQAAPERVELRYPERTVLDLTTNDGRSAAIASCLMVAKATARLDLDRFVEEIAAACRLSGDALEERRMSESLVMGWNHVRALHKAGMDVQSHSRSHRVLTTLSDDEAEADLTAGRKELEDQLGAPVVAVAYPGGHAPGRDETVRRAGYRVGFTSGTGVARLDALDLLRVPRLSMSRLYGPSFFRGMLAFPALAYRSGERKALAQIAPS
jgi:peptidoglycan/xylan/chitin deacetylase (PgdA/CDA1 family)